MIRLPPTSSLFPYTILFFFFFNDTATTEIYTLSLHDALPISLDLTPSIVGRIAEASLLIELLAMLSPITAVVIAPFLQSHLSTIPRLGPCCVLPDKPAPRRAPPFRRPGTFSPPPSPPPVQYPF